MTTVTVEVISPSNVVEVVVPAGGVFAQQASVSASAASASQAGAESSASLASSKASESSSSAASAASSAATATTKATEAAASALAAAEYAASIGPLNKETVGLPNVDNTSDADKPISTATQTALNGKADSSHTHEASEISDSTSFGRAILTAASASAQRTALGLGSAATLDAGVLAGNVVVRDESGNVPGSTNSIVQIGNSSTASNNFVLDASAANGTIKLARGNAGSTTQDILLVSADGKITFPGGSNELGVGQTWQDVKTTPGRAVNTTYTNSTGKPIEVMITYSSGANVDIHVGPTGSTIAIATTNGASTTDVLSFTVPAGHEYKWNSASGTILKWSELRS